QAVQRFVFSIRKRFPTLSIHVADQTEPTRPMRAFYERHGVHAVWMPHDIGVSACRNELVRRTSEKYLFVCDDDLIFDADTDPTGCLEILKHDPEVGIVGGRWIDEYDGQPGRVRQWALYLALDRKNRTLTGIPAYHFLAEFRHLGVHK